MATVYNWQLGRNMSYPYNAAFPQWQFAFVFNLNRCLGCQTCTMACKSTWTFARGQEQMWWNNVETKPYGGFPQHWDTKILKIINDIAPGAAVWNAAQVGPNAPYGVFNGYTVFEAATQAGINEQAVGYLPPDKEWRFPNIHEDAATGYAGKAGEFSNPTGTTLPTHSEWFFYLPRLCNHCQYPACVAACPRKAIYKRPEDGIVLIDQSRCRGYKKCIEQCPYKKPMYNPYTRISEKCIACYPRIEGKEPLTGNVPTETRCMSSCPGKIRYQSLAQLNTDGTWVNNPASPLYYMVHVEKVALPLYPQFGTMPNGYYIPPRWVPRPYLVQMFGPAVDSAIAKYMAPSRELVAILQLFRASQKIIYTYRRIDGPLLYSTTINGQPWSLYNDTVIGYGKDGAEIVRVTVEEPVHTRDGNYHSNSI
ncbi:MAG TPA: 4Fe-4S dicluster domain-containing protein [Acidiferrobacterales bacterium]|nr:4Fe-4S dicluster domain-containing protein [Acidiferrobacterales bacterium]